MGSAPSVLLLDDGDLGRAWTALARHGADFVHLYGEKIGPELTKPQDLLVTNWKRAIHLPSFDAASATSDPTWVCVHDEDFPPVRQRLRTLGVHYLIDAEIDAESLRLLFAQLLYRGAERRGTLRLPFGCEVSYRTDGESQKGVLADLSADGCRVVSALDVPPDTAVSLTLPTKLFGGDSLELAGRSIRCAPYEPRLKPPSFSIVMAFERLELETCAQLERLLAGDTSGTPVTALELPLALMSEAEEILLEDVIERRRHPRRDYQRRVAALSHHQDEPEQVVLGHDLSLKGVRLERRSGLEVGSRITLALYGRPREEPVIVGAKVVCDHGEGGLGLEFNFRTPAQKQQLEKLVTRLPALEALQDGRPDGEGLVVSRVMPPE